MVYYFRCFLRVQFYCIQLSRQLEYSQVTLILLANLHLVIQRLEKIHLHSLCLWLQHQIKGQHCLCHLFPWLVVAGPP